MTDSLPHPCLGWEGAFGNHGYGVTRLNKGMRKTLAHRMVYCVEHGIDLSDIEGRVVRHRCDNPPCVQSSHLRLGTQADNMRDMYSKGRHSIEGKAKGEGHHKSKLTEEDVKCIRDTFVSRCKTNGLSALARRYDVYPSTIQSIVKRKIWRHI